MLTRKVGGTSSSRGGSDGGCVVDDSGGRPSSSGDIASAITATSPRRSRLRGLRHCEEEEATAAAPTTVADDHLLAVTSLQRLLHLLLLCLENSPISSTRSSTMRRRGRGERDRGRTIRCFRRHLSTTKSEPATTRYSE